MDRSYWTVTGEKDGQELRWATVDVGAYERRLVEAPSGLSLGFSEVSGSLNRPTVTLTLDNSDHALDDLLLGIQPGRSKEFTGSFLGAWKFTVSLVRNGEANLLASDLIPTSSIEASESTVRLTLTAGSPVFGEFEPETLAEWLASPGLALHSQSRWMDDAELYPGQFFELLKVFAAESEEKVPLIFGKATFPLIPLSDDLSWFLAGELPPQELSDGFLIQWRTKEGRELQRGTRFAPQGMTLSRFGGGRLHVYHRLPSTDWDKQTRSSYRAEYESGLVGYRAGVQQQAGNRWIEGEGREPVHTLANVLARTTGETIDPEDLEDVAEKQAHLRGSVAGVIKDVADLEAVIESICSPTGMDIWFDGGIYRVSVAPDTADLLFAAGLPDKIGPEDVLPATTDGIPAIGTSISLADADFGAAISSVTVDWPGELQEIYPVETKVGLAVPSYASEVERRISGDWLDPQNAFRIRTDIASRSARPVRLVELYVSLDWASLQPGDLVLFQHPAIPGPQTRIGQVRNLEFLSSDAAIKLTLADYGPRETPRVALLDSYENWVLYHPPIGQMLSSWFFHEPTAPEYNKTFMEFSFLQDLPGHWEDYIGATIWIRGSVYPHLNRAWRIDWMNDYSDWDGGWNGTAYPAEEVDLGPDGVAFEALFVFQTEPSWLIMKTHASDPDHRPNYIRGADPVTGTFEDGAEGYYFE